MTMASTSLLHLAGIDGWNVSLLLLLAKATLILVAALGITLAMQRASAGARHLVWLVTLGALILMPALTAWAPLRLELLPPVVVANEGAPAAAPLTVESERASVAGAATNSASTTLPATTTIESVEPGTIARVWSSLRVIDLLQLALAVWAAGVLVIVGSLIWSARTVHRLVRDGRELTDPSWRDPLYEVSDRLGLDDPPRLLQSDEAKMPFACGLLRPTIVLPAECESWTADRRLAVLLHELAHVRRRDLAGHTLGRLVCSLYWFHPLVWTAARRLRSESERACDDLALSCGTRATDYAEHLLDIVTSVRREGTPMVALAMARRKEFEGRMLAILDPEIRRAAPSRRQSAVLIGALALISVTVGAAAPVPRVAQSGEVAQNERAADSATTPTLSDASDSATTPSPSATASSSASPSPSASPATVPAERAITSTDIAPRVDVQLRMNAAAQASPRERVSESVVQATRPSVVESIATMARGSSAALSQQARDERTVLLARVLRTDTSASLRRVAAWGLSEHAEQTVAAEALAGALRRDADESVREMAAWALGDGNDMSVAMEALHAALRGDASEKVRRTAAWALGQIGDQGSAVALTAALADASPEVRMRAIWALGQVEPKQAPKPLLALLSDKDPRVRKMTAWALYSIEDPESAPALDAALRAESDKDLQLAYIRALASLGERSVEALKSLLESRDPQVKSMAVRALAGGRASGPWPQPWPQPRPFP
jgi:beta-lactamase regulating signal transducer with metallopeptidase domain/HEAT repeat protein